MRTIGLIGGLSWHSTAIYYRRINEHVQRTLGGNHSAELLLHSLDFAQVERAQIEGRWDDLAALLAGIAQRLERAGAQAIAICANTMHKVAPAVTNAVNVPLISILDSTAQALRKQNVVRAALLGTRTTMSQPFYIEGLAQRGVQAVVPTEEVRERVHGMIHDEVIGGHILPASRRELAAIVEALAEQGAQAAILGCTELPLLLGSQDTHVPLLDTLEEHALAIASFALA
jgi:aspartate racemase